MGNESEKYKKVFNPTNWPMDTKDIPKGIRVVFAISGFVIAVMGITIGVILFYNDYRIYTILPFLIALGAVISGIKQIRTVREKR